VPRVVAASIVIKIVDNLFTHHNPAFYHFKQPIPAGTVAHISKAAFSKKHVVAVHVFCG
jgi:hypothetical protein